MGFPAPYAQQAAPPRPFRPLQGLANWAKGLAVVLMLTFFVFVGSFALLFGDIAAMERTGDPGTSTRLPAAFFGVFLGELLLFAVGIAQVLVTGFWLMRAAENVQGRGVLYASWSPGWGIGSWFIPYGNMVLPFLVCREVWRGSQPQAFRDPAWKTRTVPAWIAWWWAFAVGAPVLTFFTLMVTGILSAASGSAAPLAILVIPGAAWVASLYLFWKFVQELTAIQQGWVGPSPT